MHCSSLFTLLVIDDSVLLLLPSPSLLITQLTLVVAAHSHSIECIVLESVMAAFLSSSSSEPIASIRNSAALMRGDDGAELLMWLFEQVALDAAQRGPGAAGVTPTGVTIEEKMRPAVRKKHCQSLPVDELSSLSCFTCCTTLFTSLLLWLSKPDTDS